jgi:hypothetical protein
MGELGGVSAPELSDIRLFTLEYGPLRIDNPGPPVIFAGFLQGQRSACCPRRRKGFRSGRFTDALDSPFADRIPGRSERMAERRRR